ncbi:MAG: hypothetical protein IRY84_03115 [Thermobispora bispora]|nr:hypothetical protein [Thermobispora bispora]
MSEPRNAAGGGGPASPGSHRPCHDAPHRDARDHATRSRPREIAELAALFLAVGLAHVLTTLLGHRDPGPVVLIGLGLALLLGSAAHRRLSASGGLRPRARVGAGQTTSLWRVRVRVAERPGRLAALAGAFARLRRDILALQIAPAGGAAMSEPLRTPDIRRHDPGEPVPETGPTVMTIPVPAGGVLVARRPGLPFTPTETARAATLAAAARHLGGRVR